MYGFTVTTNVASLEPYCTAHVSVQMNSEKYVHGSNGHLQKCLVNLWIQYKMSELATATHPAFSDYLYCIHYSCKPHIIIFI